MEDKTPKRIILKEESFDIIGAAMEVHKIIGIQANIIKKHPRITRMLFV